MYEGIAFDTIRINGFPGSPSPPNQYLLRDRTIHASQSVTILSKIPVSIIQPDHIRMVRSDTVEIPSLTVIIDSLDRRKIMIRSRWEEGAHRLSIPQGAITDIFGSQNDSLELVYQVSPQSNYGQIFIGVDSLDPDLQYLVQLLQSGTEPLDQFVLSGVSGGKGAFMHMLPQSYRIRIVEDLNRNGRWDTGNFAQQSQPERVLIQNLDPLRAGWDLEAEILWQ